MDSLIVDSIRSLGAFGVALLMFAENLFPPLPSEIIMPLAGFLASRGDMSFPVVVLAGTAGSATGACFWFWVGTRIDNDRLRDWLGRHGVWLAMTPADLDRAEEWFRRRGSLSVLIGRLVPVVRTLISVPAGVARMSPLRFTLFTLLGSGIWTTALAVGGWLLGRRFRAIEQYLGVITWVVLGLAMVLYIVRVARIRRGAGSGAAGSGRATRR